MSANPVARSSSRRSVLVAAIAGTAAGAATFAGHVALAAPVEPDPAEVALVAWLNAAGHLNTATDVDDSAYEPLRALEMVVLLGLAPSPMAAAALVLNHMPYEIDGPGAADPDGERITLGKIMRGRPDDERLPYGVLRCLQPALTGKIADLAADLLDNPERALCESLLFRAYCGEVSL